MNHLQRLELIKLYIQNKVPYSEVKKAIAMFSAQMKKEAEDKRSRGK